MTFNGSQELPLLIQWFDRFAEAIVAVIVILLAVVIYLLFKEDF